MSNGARNRKISRLRPSSEKRTHQRVITARYWAVQRMAAAAAEELAEIDGDVVSDPTPPKQRRIPRFLRKNNPTTRKAPSDHV